MSDNGYFVHESSYVDEGVQIGEGTTDLALLPHPDRREDRQEMPHRAERGDRP